MNRTIYRILLLAMSLSIAACSKDDTLEEPTSECYISSFTLGTLSRTVTSNGTSTESTYNGSYYGMGIDQRAGLITNADPLLTGTNLTSVTVTVEGKGSFVYAPEADQSVWSAYSSTTPIDLSVPVVFRAYATDGSGFRQYTVTVSVRTTEPGSYTWETLTAPATLAERKERRAISWQDGLLLLSADASDALHAATWVNSIWSDEQTCTGADGAQLSSLQSFDSQLWMSTSDGQLLTSADGTAWTALTTEQTGDEVRLIAASSKALYACIHNAGAEPQDRLARSTDGIHWETCAADADMALFPAESASVRYQLAGSPCVVVAGKAADRDVEGETVAGDIAVWRKSEKGDEPWFLLSHTGDNGYILPWQADMTILRYNDTLIAFTGTKTTTYISRDNGITWKAYGELTLPATATYLAATVRGNYIYFFSDAAFLRARVN